MIISKKRIMALSFTLLVTILFSVSFGVLGNAQTLYSCGSPCCGNNPFFHTINPNTGATLTTTEITLTGETVKGCNGLARDPTTGVCWMIVNVGELGVPTARVLATIDETTGVATAVGNTAEAFADITFDSAGTLYGVTGDGASTPETLFTLSKTDGTPTFVQTLGNGDDGEAIAHNPNNGLIYHASGFNDVFESINPVTNIITDIPISGDNMGEVLALVHQSGNLFLGTNLDNDFISITTSGVVTFLGDTDTDIKGLAFDCGVAPEPPTMATISIPTLSEWGLIAMAGILGFIGYMVIRRKKVTA